LTHGRRLGTIEFVFFLKFGIRITANAGALWVADRLFAGFSVIPHVLPSMAGIGVESMAQTFLISGLILAILFAFVRPILKLLSFPLIILTFGIFNIVISIILIALADWIAGGIEVTGFIAYVGGALIISAANAFIELLFRTS